MRHAFSSTLFSAALALLLSATGAEAQTIRDASRLNVGGFNPNGDNQQDGTSIAVRGTDVYTVWAEQFGTTNFTQDIYFARSTDDGATFSAPFIAETDVSGNVDEPQLEVKGSTVLISYNETDSSMPGGEGVHVVVSNDGGSTFRPEVTLSVQADAVAGSDCDIPQVFIESASNMYVVYDEDSQAVAAGLPGGSGGNNIYIAYTKDGGASWTKDVPISFDTNANRPEIVVANGFVVVAAELGANGSNTIAFFVSQDGGATFAPYLEVPSSGPDTDFVNRNECTFMAVSSVTNTVSLVYLDRPTGANEVYTAGLLLPNGVGTQYCTAAANSTGTVASLMGEGSLDVTDNAFALNATSLPTSSFGFFITSQSQGFVMNPGGSAGNLCLSSSIGRYVGSGQIKNSGAAGAFSLDLDLTQTPQPNGFVSITSGQTWNFQAWYRDSVGGQPTSNFSNGLEVGFN